MLSYAVIDAYPVIRTGIALFLKSHFTGIQILDSDSIISFQESYLACKPDVIILGFNHDFSVTKIDLVIAVKKAYPDAKLILYDDMQYSETHEKSMNLKTILSYMKVGINGYISKSDNMEEFIDCLRDIFVGKNYISSEGLTQASNDEIIKTLQLSQREFEIAAYICTGMSINVIAEKLQRAPSTISTTKATIFKKLNVNNIVTLLNIFQQMGARQRYDLLPT